MADINKVQNTHTSKQAANDADKTMPPALEAGHQDDLIELVELLFFAYRDFTEDPDTILREYGFGRAHHRVLHFVYRYPGLRVADLLEILKITKQSLARVLKQLVDEGFIEQRPGREDRRERRLHVTERGGELNQRLIAPQMQRIEQAMANSGTNQNGLAKKFLYFMINSRERDEVVTLFQQRDAAQQEDISDKSGE